MTMWVMAAATSRRALCDYYIHTEGVSKLGSHQLILSHKPHPPQGEVALLWPPPMGGGGGYRSDAGEAPAAFLNTPSGVQKKKLGRGAGGGRRRRGEEADGG